MIRCCRRDPCDRGTSAARQFGEEIPDRDGRILVLAFERHGMAAVSAPNTMISRLGFHVRLPYHASRYVRHSTPHVFFAVVQSVSMAKAAAQFRGKQPSVSATITFLEVAMKLPHRRRFLRLAAGAMRTLAVVLALLVASGVGQIAAVQAADINAFIS